MLSNMTGGVTNSLTHPPQPLLSDRIQLILMLFMFTIGAPLNLIAFSKLFKRRSFGRNGRLTLLKLHLNLTDLMVLFIYVTATVCWQVTYEWRGGEALCKVVKFLSSTSFQASSNLVVSIAFDRLLTVFSGRRWYKRRFRRRTVWYVRCCIIIGWLLAVLISLPQLHIWRVYSPYPQTNPDWHQCTTVYAMYSHKKRLTKLVSTFPIGKTGNISDLIFDDEQNWNPVVSQLAYNLTHVLFVFWIPAILIISCYSLVLFALYRLETKKRRCFVSSTCCSDAGNGGKMDIKKGFNFPLQIFQSGWWKKQQSNNSVPCESNGTKELILSANSTADPTGMVSSGIDSRKESQSTTVSSHVYLVPVEISRIRNNTFRISFTLILAYLLFWTPYNVLALWQFIDDSSYKKHANSIKFLNALIVLNSVVNPFLYGAVRFKGMKLQV